MKARICNYKVWLNITEVNSLKKYLFNALKKSEFNILNFCEHYFEPYGYTAIWLLGESHCAVHTFPEENKTYLELSSCSKEKYDKFIVIIKNTNYIFRR